MVIPSEQKNAQSWSEMKKSSNIPKRVRFVSFSAKAKMYSANTWWIFFTLNSF